MKPSDRTFVRQREGAEIRAHVPVPMRDAFKALSDELGMTPPQHLRRILRAYLAQNLIGYDEQ